MGLIAAAVSSSSVLSGQSHRSGPNFQILDAGLDSDETSFKVACPSKVTFDIMRDVSVLSDKMIAKGVKNGTFLEDGALVPGHDYYIANPSGASGSFSVAFDCNFEIVNI